jgi:hypothetical protein
VLERLDAADVVSLAHHLHESGPDGGNNARAVQYALAAGEHGLTRSAPADAELWFGRALELVEEATGSDPRPHLLATIGVGRAQRDQAQPEFRATLLQAARQADAAGQRDLLVAAVLANQRGYSSIIGDVDAERVELVQRALAVVGAAPTADRAALLALLASELAFDADHARTRGLAEQAVALARRLDDERTAAGVLAHAAGAWYDPAHIPAGGGSPRRPSRGLWLWATRR